MEHVSFQYTSFFNESRTGGLLISGVIMPHMATRSKKTSTPVIEPVEEEIPAIEETPTIIEEEETITFKRSHFYAAVSVLTFFAGILVGGQVR